MSSMDDHLKKVREDRLAREKARIDKLREMNLKKYNKPEPLHSTVLIKKPANATNNNMQKPHVKNYFHVNNTTERSMPAAKKLPPKESVTIPPKVTDESAPILISNKAPISTKTDLIPKIPIKRPTAAGDSNKSRIPSATIKEITKKSFATTNHVVTSTTSRKSVASTSRKSIALAPTSRKSIAPPKPDIPQTNRQSVFERLYKPKFIAKKPTDDAVKIQTDPNYLKKIIKDSGLISNKRHTIFEVKDKVEPPVRRSISAVHFKRINKGEINNCIHKWASIGDNLNKVHLNEINEDETVNQDKVVSAVKSDRKRVKFQTPNFNFNTPKPEELQNRLKNWLQKRGKSLDSYHHLQCFGIHHLRQREILPIEPPKFELYDEENKENIALEHDSDNDSYSDNMNEDCEKEDGKEMWRRASYVNDSVDLNDTQNSTLTNYDTVQQVDDVLLGALNDLTELLREGFDWEQCARWLRAIRERFPFAPDTAAYWECRAALEETRGDLPASVQCWEEAIAKGTERSVVESNLDQLLDKFMQLKISPNSGKRKPVDSKMVDVKNVFKSTIIRFAVQQAKLRRSSQLDLPKYTVTPVRRSSRLSCYGSAKRPLQECHSVKQAKELAPVEFVPNPSLSFTP